MAAPRTARRRACVVRAASRATNVAATGRVEPTAPSVVSKPCLSRRRPATLCPSSRGRFSALRSRVAGRTPCADRLRIIAPGGERSAVARRTLVRSDPFSLPSRFLLRTAPAVGVPSNRFPQAGGPKPTPLFALNNGFVDTLCRRRRHARSGLFLAEIPSSESEKGPAITNKWSDVHQYHPPKKVRQAPSPSLYLNGSIPHGYSPCRCSSTQTPKSGNTSCSRSIFPIAASLAAAANRSGSTFR